VEGLPGGWGGAGPGWGGGGGVEGLKHRVGFWSRWDCEAMISWILYGWLSCFLFRAFVGLVESLSHIFVSRVFCYVLDPCFARGCAAGPVPT
jgi:hypothetical protein